METKKLTIFSETDSYFSEMSPSRTEFFGHNQSLKSPCFGQIICAAGKFLKKQVKKAVFKHFLKNFDKKLAFFWRALPLKGSIFWRLRRL